MLGKKTIDVVIPSFRLTEQYLLPIINLCSSTEYNIKFYIIADNPMISIPRILKELSDNGRICLLINERNLGFSATRNKGIFAGSGKWILLLDDDIIPDENLLDSYCRAIDENENAIGFVGITEFPPTFNNATKALKINGMTVHFQLAKTENRLKWAPTANIMLNREKLVTPLFNENLKKGGEDIEFLVRNSLMNNEAYIACPAAIVTHPWWSDGRVQTRRMIRYGIGAAEISTLPILKNYTYYDFTNTSETIILLLLLSPFAFVYGLTIELLIFIFANLLSEFITNFIKASSNGFPSLGVTTNLFWVKNTYEFGYLLSILQTGKFTNFTKRLDVSFRKEDPSWYRLNRWKILKLLLITVFTICWFLIK